MVFRHIESNEIHTLQRVAGTLRDIDVAIFVIRAPVVRADRLAHGTLLVVRRQGIVLTFQYHSPLLLFFCFPSRQNVGLNVMEDGWSRLTANYHGGDGPNRHLTVMRLLSS